MSEYQAGVCNIGPSEIRKRQRVALLGYSLAAAILLSHIFLDTPSIPSLLFASLFVGSVGFVQSRKKFCLAFGLMGTFNVSESMKKVVAPADLKADRRTALVILLQSAALALVIFGALIALPL